MFGAFIEGICVGCVGVEEAEESSYWFKKLAVLPEYRHKGYGKALVDFVFDYAKECGGERISIGIIDENHILKNWYLEYGFEEVEKKTFIHLPFTVCYMMKEI